MSKPREVTVNLRLNNNRDDDLTLYLEPWCEQYSFPPTATFEIVARGPEGEFLEIDCGTSGLTLYGWTGSTIDVFQNG